MAPKPDGPNEEPARPEPSSSDQDSGSGVHRDESWKEEARREKERLQEETKDAPLKELPPADFLSLLSDVGLQAMLALGLVGPPEREERVVNLPAARYAIDTLRVIEEKTKGNLTEEEQKTLQQLLANLQMSWVETMNQVAAARAAKPEEGSSGGSGKIIVEE